MASLGSEVTANQAIELINRLGFRGLTLKRVMDLLSDDDLATEWVALYPESRWAQLRNAMPIPDQNIWSEFTEEHFPLGTKPAYEYDLEVVLFDRDMDDEVLLAEIKERGFELPEPEDGMAYAASHPDDQMRYPIVVRLARPWVDQSGRACVFFLDSLEKGRFLLDSFIDYRWRNHCRFLLRRPRK